MAKGKRAKSKPYKRFREEEEKMKPESTKPEVPKKLEEKYSNRTNSYFKSEDMQEICYILNLDELGDQHCFLGAVVIGKFDVVKKLLKDGYCIDYLDENKETALMLAVKHYRLEMVDFLLARGADFSLVDGEGNNALLLAAQSELWDQDSFSGLWNSVCNHPQLQPNHVNKVGYSLLHYVTKRQWKTVLELLLSFQVFVDCCTNRGVTPLIMAASRGDSVFVKALLDAGADISVEDQQSCTAICYAIAFSLQKSMTESNRALELLLAAVNDDNSKLPLEQYLQRRLDILLNPPKNKSEFSKTVSGVLIHVLTFFARFIYSGMDLLLELSLFRRTQEAIEHHLEDCGYMMSMLGVLLELVRHCDCCCQGFSQAELAEVFFAAGLGKGLLDILQRHGLGKTSVIKAVLLPLLHMCTSESYKARTWLEANHEFLQPFYNKYMRSFPSMFLETNGDPHLEIEKEHSLSFQRIMKILKTQGLIVTKEEHSQAQLKVKEDMTLVNSVYTIVKPNSSTTFTNSLKTSNEKNLNIICGKRKKSKPSAVYNSIIQYNFGKLDIAHLKKEQPTKEHLDSTKLKEESNPETKPLKPKPHKEKKSRIAIKEIIQPKEINEAASNTISEKVEIVSKDKFETLSKIISPLSNKQGPTLNKSVLKDTVEERFSEGYQLFQMEDDLAMDIHLEEENKITRDTCEWLESCPLGTENKTVSEAEIVNTITYLEEIFNRIINRYDSTWRKQYERGYLGAQGDCEDLLKLMTVLPALENYHMEKLLTRWHKFCKQVKDHASKNHVIYAAMVSEMQLFLLEFEAKLDEKNLQICNDGENSSIDSYIDTESCIRHAKKCDLYTLSNGKPIEDLINQKSIMIEEEKLETDLEKNNTGLIKEVLLVKSNFEQAVEFVDDIYISDSESDENGVSNSIWDGKVDNSLKLESNLKLTTDCVKNNPEILKEHVEEPMNEVVKPPLEENTCHLLNILSQAPTTGTAMCGYLMPTKGKEKRVMDVDYFQAFNVSSTSECTTWQKPPPGFENVRPRASTDSLSSFSALAFCGTKYETLSLALVTLPACKRELYDGDLRLASNEFQAEFKLFNGCNFGDVEFGLSANGMPQAVRRFQKYNTLCNQAISTSLYSLVCGMLSLRHDHILPYMACYDQPIAVVFATPLCYQDLGQYIRQQRQILAESLENWATFTPCLINMAKQMMSGLHYLHTSSKPVVHGNLKPSNVLVDVSGAVRIAEFGLHKVLFQQQGPPQSAMIWWARDCYVTYQNSWKFVCTQQSDIQSAGMLIYFILTLGQHPFGQSLPDIIENIKDGVINIRTQDVNATDLLCWMLSYEPDQRPNTYDVLRHVLFWSSTKKWELLNTCCGLGVSHNHCPLPLDKMYTDLDKLGQLSDNNTSWISILKENCERKIGSSVFEDNPSGLLKFLSKNLKNWTEIKDIFLELFPSLPLNLFRMIERTIWIDHPEFEPFTKVD